MRTFSPEIPRLDGVESIERPSWTSWPWPAAIGIVAVLLALLLIFPGGSVAAAGYLTGFAVLVVGVTLWAFLYTRRQRRRFEGRLEEWAKAQAVQEERLRIARDLHDLASHGLGTITVRASTAKLTDDAVERLMALDDIERLGRTSTAELRSMLAVLRGPDAASAPMRPADSLTDMPGIVDAARRAGVDVTLTADDLGEVSAGVQVTVCAIVREALTNTVRQAGRTTAHVTLTSSTRTIRVDVRDDGPSSGWRPHPGTGRGLDGLRERVALHGGTLTTGPFESGFRVTADLPREGTP